MVLHAFYVVEANVRKDIRQNKSFKLIFQIEIEKIFCVEKYPNTPALSWLVQQGNKIASDLRFDFIFSGK